MIDLLKFAARELVVKPLKVAVIGLAPILAPSKGALLEHGRLGLCSGRQQVALHLVGLDEQQGLAGSYRERSHGKALLPVQLLARRQSQRLVVTGDAGHVVVVGEAV